MTQSLVPLFEVPILELDMGYIKFPEKERKVPGIDYLTYLMA